MLRKNWMSLFAANAALPRRVVSEALESRQLLSSVPSGFVDAKVAGGISQGTGMAVAPDGRVFIAQQAGKLVVVKNNKLLSTPFLSVTTPNDASEGLIGVAVDPNFATNGYVYISYTKSNPLRTVISRFTANGDVAKSGSENVIFTTNNLQNHEHNGGALAFGSDGKLYVALGDDLTITNAQSLKSTQGKILRINSDGSIPTDDPYYTKTTGAARAIWAYGFRNPFTLSIQPGTGRILAGDVGSDFWEELDDINKGGNYGWSDSEGPSVNPGEIAPLYSYPHNGTSAAIIAGPFYNPKTVSFPSSYVGKVFFADYARGTIQTIDLTKLTTSSFISGLDRCVAMALAPDGSLYYLERGGVGTGELHKVSYSVNAKPAIIDQPDTQKIAAGQPVTFTVGATGTTPLTYQWRRNGKNISGASGANYTINSVSTSDNGAKFDCIVTNKLGSATSSAAMLTVITDKPPVPVITLPDPTILYNAGDVIQFAGTATDPEDGVLPPSAFTWTSLLHHDTHTHPFYGPVSGITSGELDIPQVEETSSNVYYQLFLTVTDSAGVSTTIEQDILPHKINFTVQSNVPGLSLGVDAVTDDEPTTITGVTGIRRQLSAPLIQVLNGNVYQFGNWSDGGDATHYIFTPSADTIYTANYTQIGTVPIGNGLKATYYDNADFTGKSVSRTDPQVNFIWSLDPPITGFGTDSFSVRWQGYIVAPTSETYTFTMDVDDGAKLWVNNQVVINQFNSTGTHQYTGTIAMQAGVAVPIKLEYKDVTGFAESQLSWSSPMLPMQIVPQGALFTTQPNPPPPPPNQVVINDSADAYVRSGTPDQNYGNDTSLLVKKDTSGGNTRSVYLRFDLTGQSSNFQAAALSLVGSINNTDSVAVDIFGASAAPAWDESTLTWNTQFATDPTPLGTITVNTPKDATYQVDLTSYIKSQLNAGATSVTLVLKAESPTTSNAIFHSKENDGGAPQLLITPS
jgi:glucose/arabinose dehydrogenase